MLSFPSFGISNILFSSLHFRKMKISSQKSKHLWWITIGNLSINISFTPNRATIHHSFSRGKFLILSPMKHRSKRVSSRMICQHWTSISVLNIKYQILYVALEYLISIWKFYIRINCMLISDIYIVHNTNYQLHIDIKYRYQQILIILQYQYFDILKLTTSISIYGLVIYCSWHYNRVYRANP